MKKAPAKTSFLFFILLFSLLILGCARTAPNGTTEPEPNVQQTPENGRLVFTMADAAAEMQSVSSVKITVDSVKVHSASEGWVTVSS